MTCRLSKRYMGGSANFNGSSSKIVLPFTPSVTALTVMMRVKLLPGYTNGGALFTWFSAYDRDGFIIKFDTSTQKFVCVGANASAAQSVLISTGQIKYNQWYNIAFTYVPNLHRFYTNGVKEGEDTSVVVTTNGTSPTLGSFSYGSGGWAKCLISEFAYADSVLTTTEMDDFFRTGVLPSGVTNFYKLDDQPSSYIDTIGGATGTGTATTYSPDVPVQLPMVVDEGARSSLSFDGSTGSVSLGTPAALQQDVFSYAVEFKANALTTGVLMGWSGVNGHYIAMGAASGSLRLVKAGVATVATAPAYIITNRWVKLVVTYDEDGIASFYVGGKLIYQVTNLVTWAYATSFKVGDGASKFSGIIKSARMYSRVLTVAEIKSLHFNNIVPNTGLVGEWSLNEGAGTIAYDSSGNGNDGTITGATWSADVPSKARTLVNGNLVPNGDFSYVPRVNVAVTTQQRWLDGTSGGSTTNNLFKFALTEVTNNAAAVFETKDNVKTLKASTTGVNSVSTFSNVRAGDASRVLPSGIKLSTNTQYTVTLYMESMAISGSATTGARAFINLYNALGAYSSTISIVTGVVTTTNKTKYSVTFTTGASETIGTIWGGVIGNDGAATLIMDAWFSDIQLQKTTLPTRTTTTTRTTVTCP